MQKKNFQERLNMTWILRDLSEKHYTKGVAPSVDAGIIGDGMSFEKLQKLTALSHRDKINSLHSSFPPHHEDRVNDSGFKKSSSYEGEQYILAIELKRTSTIQYYHIEM
ncbi:MAG: hypothetical protein D3924_00865 [Candidatus Electrothrix sp. AR4]|nr:hypothetical protein [Candidatus Electrothrix sp. AR4]